MISLNALLGRPVEYYEYPWAIEGRLRDAQSRFRSRFQPSDVGYIFAKSMPRSGHRFLSECLAHYFGPELHYCGFYWPGCCHRIPCKHPQQGGRANLYFMQKSHDFGFRDSTRLNGKYLIQYRSPIPRLQSNYDLAVARGTVEQSKVSFAAFAERETAYFINFYRKWVAVPQLNALAVAYEDLIEQQERTRRRDRLHHRGLTRQRHCARSRACRGAGRRQQRNECRTRSDTAPIFRSGVVRAARAQDRTRLRPGPHPLSVPLNTIPTLI